MGNQENIFDKLGISFNTTTALDLANNVPKQNYAINPDIQKSINESLKAVSEANRKREEREDEKLVALKAIEQNTANLADIVHMIQKSNEKQDDVIALLTEIFSISKATTLEEADNKYRTIINKVTSFTEDIETIQKTTLIAGTVYNLVLHGIKLVGG